MTQRIGIVIPGGTDTNRGDQALTWETARLIKDARLCDDVMILDVGDTLEERQLQTSQSLAEGYKFLRHILPHPRRGQHAAKDKVKESLASLIHMMVRSVFDFLRSYTILLFASFPQVIRILLSGEEYETYQVFRNAATIAVKGGGFLHSYGGISSPYYIWYLTFYIRLAHRLRKPVVVLPNSFGPFIGPTVERQMRYVFSKCVFISARESLSAQSLGKVLQVEIPVYPDLGYYLQSSQKNDRDSILLSNKVPLSSKPYVGFTLRPYRFPRSPDPNVAYANYLSAFESLIRYVSSKGFFPVFITQVSGPSATENDRLAIEDIIAKVSDLEYSWVDFAGNCRNIKALYGCLNYLVGTRFHSVVFAQDEGVPCIAVAYGGNKATGIMGDTELGDYVIPIESVTGEALRASFDLLVKNREDVLGKMLVLKEQRNKLRQELIDQIVSQVQAFRS